MVDQSAVRFFHVWDTYARVVAENYMYHRELGVAVQAALQARFARRPFTILDLGCGDAATFAPLLGDLPVGSYRGAALSAAAPARAGAGGRRAPLVTGVPRLGLRGPAGTRVPGPVLVRREGVVS